MSHKIKQLPLLLLLLVCRTASGSSGFLIVKTDAANHTNAGDVKVCVQYNGEFKKISSFPETFLYQDNYPSFGCENSSAGTDYSGRLVFVKRGNCTFAQKARHIQNASGAGVIVVSNSTIHAPGGEPIDYKQVNIYVALISQSAYEKLATLLTPGSSLKLTHDGSRLIAFSSYLLMVIAVLTCGVAAWWVDEWHQCVLTLKKKSPREIPAASASSPIMTASSDGGQLLNLSFLQSLAYVLFASLFLTLMYFFYSYLVYVIIFVFVLQSSVSLYVVLYTVAKKLSCCCEGGFTYIPRLPCFPCVAVQPSAASLLLMATSIAVSVTWFVVRKSSFAWVLLDVLGVCFCIFVINQVKLANFRVSALLLSMFFVYDVFYVFVTPYIMPSGESIMVSVATGGSSGSTEELPMLFKMPKFRHSECDPDSPSMLGFGDVVLPGLHVALCRRWDRKRSSLNQNGRSNLYFITSMIAYMLGLACTIVALVLMEKGQPALLYIVPCILIASAAVAVCRGELDNFLRFRSLEEDKKHDIASDASDGPVVPKNAHDVEKNNLLLAA